VDYLFLQFPEFSFSHLWLRWRRWVGNL